MIRLLKPLLLLLLLAFGPTACWGDIFVLTTGGQIVGELVNRGESPRKTFRIRTLDGGEITINANQLDQIVPQSAREVEYEKIRPTFPDTIEGHWKLAEWCKEQALSKQRETHLRRIIELDQDHEEARRALGYSRYDGKWMTRDEWHESRGFVRYGGTWRLPQEIEIIEREKKDELEQRTWKIELNRMRASLRAGGSRGAQAQEAMLAIEDPQAVPALRAALADETSRSLRLLYLQVLKRIGTSAAHSVMAECSLISSDEETRLSALDLLDDVDHAPLIGQYVGALNSRHNYMVNRAAIALGRLEAKSAVVPLIDALVTVHKETITPVNPGAMTGRFANDGSVGFGAGGGGPRVVRNNVSNQAVLDALIKITGQNFEFNISAWKRWYASQKTKGIDLDFRRGGT